MDALLVGFLLVVGWFILRTQLALKKKHANSLYDLSQMREVFTDVYDNDEGTVIILTDNEFSFGALADIALKKDRWLKKSGSRKKVVAMVLANDWHRSQEVKIVGLLIHYTKTSR